MHVSKSLHCEIEAPPIITNGQNPVTSEGQATLSLAEASVEHQQL